MKNYYKYLKSSLLLIFSLFIMIGCTKKTTIEPISKSELLMGTVVTVTIYDNSDETILDKVFTKVRDLEATLSINEEGTLVDKINENSGISPVKVDEETFALIKRGLEFSYISEGLFDITVGPLVKLWSIGLPEQKLPTQKEIDSVLPLINKDKLILDEENLTVFLEDKNMKIDLGGIAKGFTADVISEILSENNVNSAIIDLGGNIFAKGIKVNSSKWKIGIQNPNSDRGSIIGSISVENKSVVTSGTYERYFEQDGVKYHHILNPQTGYPYENNISGITIVSDKSMDGDALSTSVFAMGVEKGLEFVNNFEGIDAIFVTNDNKIYLSDGLKDAFNLTNSDFIIAN